MDSQQQSKKRIVVCTHDVYLFTHIDLCMSKQIGPKGKIEYVVDGKTLLHDAEIRQMDVLFMDIALKDIACFNLVKQLRAIDPDFVLIMLIDNSDDALIWYGFRAFRCLMKQSLYEQLESCMDELMTELGIGREVIEFRVADRMCSVYADEILYAECQHHDVFIYYRGKNKKTSKIYDTLTDIEALLVPHGFYRIHNSYIINMAYLDDVTAEWAVLVSGHKLPISKHCHHDLRVRLKEQKKMKKPHT